MTGSEHPPFHVEDPAPRLSRAPLFRPSQAPADELAEHLSWPHGMTEPGPLDARPQSLVEARLRFTQLARELGAEYRTKRGIELRADVSGIEAMQAVLLESYPDRAVRTDEEAEDVRRHGALFGEILARKLDAEWIDIAPVDLGDWSMIVPPDLRVWPFGRVLRLIQMGHKERDLVSTFLELEARARRR